MVRSKKAKVIPFKTVTGIVKFTPQEEINRKNRERRERQIKELHERVKCIMRDE
ncbi:hypothetical protein [Alkalihalobacillus sp. TS-13]|uniref:hypothetical protein n=1 Tax=Alkalihalobacillus sp. TS-13 TaxID=2842455 RepID=UPI001C86DD0B|nr:hypothetical protein [Alkalihalobacillus sp. TS-13]